MEMIGRGAAAILKKTCSTSKFASPTPPRCVARQGFATKGGKEGRGRECKENTGNVGGETVSRYNQARFLFAFAFKWFRVRYTRNVMQKVRVRIRVKSNRCTTQRVRIHTAQWTFCPAVFSFPIFPLLLPPPFLFSSLRSLLFFFSSSSETRSIFIRNSTLAENRRCKKEGRKRRGMN